MNIMGNSLIYHYFSQPFSSNGSASDIYKRDLSLEPVDTLKPLDIVEDEELERISGLLQRDNLVRGLGIVEHVYRLLHCTPGTVGIQLKNDHKYNVRIPILPDITQILVVFVWCVILVCKGTTNSECCFYMFIFQWFCTYLAKDNPSSLNNLKKRVFLSKCVCICA